MSFAVMSVSAALEETKTLSSTCPVTSMGSSRTGPV